jgi:hypothetical protein
VKVFLLQVSVEDPGYHSWLRKKKYRAKGVKVKKLVKKRNFWKRVRALVAVTDPVMEILRLADGPAPSMSKIYHHSSLALESIGKVELEEPGLNDEIKRAFETR